MGRIILHNRIFTDNYGINYAIIIMFFFYKIVKL